MNSANEGADVHVRRAQWPTDADALQALRATVFIEEQGVPQSIEWDGRDDEALHVIAEGDGEALGCGRLLPDGRIGRLAVLAPHRGTGIGARMLTELLALAREKGMHSVYLHAQADAIGFYERAGFSARGDVFQEAGIDHRDMAMELDYQDWDSTLLRLRYPDPFRQLVVAQARLARRELRILSPLLDTQVFDQGALSDAIRALIRQGRSSRVQIIVRDARPIVQRGHGLLQLARRLPSAVAIRRLAEHPDWDGDTQVIRDRDSLLVQPPSVRDPGFYRPGDRARCEVALQRFDELWHSAEPDPEFRSLSI